MTFSEKVLRSDEKAIFRLRELYSKYGYSRYKVSKFEEYDLYARNKSFLISESILTFTDTNGRLMALKPDVTLSIVKNVGEDSNAIHKLYYNENVYRTLPSSDGFCEIMQTGLECIGRIDLYQVCEVLMLAEQSLALISADHVLDLSHMGFLSGLMENVGLDGEAATQALAAIGSKNTPVLRALASRHGLTEEQTQAICYVCDVYEPLESALHSLQGIVAGEKMTQAYEEMCQISRLMKDYGCTDKLYLDFSIINDMNYYNGVIFRGFINGIPDGILSGGRYDSLMAKMGKKCGAVGFAVYLDLLERFGNEAEAYDVDTVLLYDDTVDAGKVLEAVRMLSNTGKTVRAESGDGTISRCRQLLKITKGGIEILENHD